MRPFVVYNEMMIDTHCHLTSERYSDDTDVLERALAAGVRRLVTIAVTLSDAQRVRALAEQENAVWGTVGVHPLDVKGEGVPTVDALRALADCPKIVALGETGLDLYHGTLEDFEDQRQAFFNHICVAHALNKAVVIHAREAFSETEAVLDEAVQKYPGVRYILHCFTGDFPTAERFIEKYGCYVSFSGIVTFKKGAEAIREAARYIPLTHLLCETDAPYLAPDPWRGKRNEPAWVRYVYEVIAQLRNTEVQDIISQVDRNAERAFGL